MDAGPTANSKARIRLSELSVHAIALVGEGANLRRFAEVRKALTMDEKMNKALVLPKAAQEQIAGGVTRGIEAMTALLDLVKTAQVSEDGGAVVPPELAEQIKVIGMMVVALADQFGAAPASAPASQAGDESMSGMSAEEMALAKGMSSSVVKAAITTMKNFEAVSKGKVKMSFENAMKIHGGLMEKLYSIASELAPLVAEYGADGVTAALGMSETDKTAKSRQQNANDGALVDPMKRVEDAIAALRGDVNKIAKTRNPSNASTPRDNAGPAPEHRIHYGKDYAEIVRNEQQRTNGAAT